MAKFSNPWDETKPAGTRSKLLGDDDIREFKQQVRERFAEDHVALQNESDDALVGFHNKVTLTKQGSNPAGLADTFIFFSKTVSGATELHVQHETAGVIQWSVLGKINIGAFDIASAAQGDILIRGVSAFERLGIGTAYNRLRVNSGATALEYTTQIRRTFFWYIPGSVSTGTRKSARLYLPFACTFKKWILEVETAPSGASLVVDINLSGSTIATSKPTIASGASSGNGTSFDTTTGAQGQYLDVDIDTVGSSVAGAGLTIMLEVEPQ